MAGTGTGAAGGVAGGAADGDVKRIDVVSDTHGFLSPELVAALDGADLILHAGDMTSRSDYERLWKIARVEMCMGNNDWSYDYGPSVKRTVRVAYAGLRFQLAHYRELLAPDTCDVAICGHTHRPYVEEPAAVGEAIVMNPGSPTYPRSELGPTIGRILVADGKVLSATIVRLDPEDDAVGDGGAGSDAGTGARRPRWFRW